MRRRGPGWDMRYVTVHDGSSPSRRVVDYVNLPRTRPQSTCTSGFSWIPWQEIAKVSRWDGTDLGRE
jgi:hypothetical protein